MSQKIVKDIAASVRQRLLNRSKERREDFQLTLIHFALERLMYRSPVTLRVGPPSQYWVLPFF